MILGVSQRVVVDEKTGERRDCLDQHWSQLLRNYGHFIIAIPNDPQNLNFFLENIKVDGVVLTGGNDLSSLSQGINMSIERDQTEIGLLSYASDHQIPVLGVCRGFQMLNSFLGGALTKVSGHVGYPHEVTTVNDDFVDSQSFTVNSFHDYVIQECDLAKGLRPLAVATDGTVESAISSQHNWIGIMWHPERSVSSLDSIIIKSLF